MDSSSPVLIQMALVKLNNHKTNLKVVNLRKGLAAMAEDRKTLIEIGAE